MHKCLHVLMIAALACAMAINISCNSGGGSDSSGSGGSSGGGENGSATAVKATFRVDVFNSILGSLTGNPATGTAGTWLLNGTEVQNGVFFFKTQYYTISFEGDVSGLPDNVQVTVTWTSQDFVFFWWGTPEKSSGSETFSMPKQGGGSVGSGADKRPTVVWTNPPIAAANQVLGTVTFKASGVHTLTLSVLNVNF